jgi:hypothetical protein
MDCIRWLQRGDATSIFTCEIALTTISYNEEDNEKAERKLSHRGRCYVRYRLTLLSEPGPGEETMLNPGSTIPSPGIMVENYCCHPTPKQGSNP